MDRVNEKILVTMVDSDLDIQETKIFTTYERARAYFMELLGKEMLYAFWDSEECEGNGRKLASFYSEVDKTLYFEAGGGEPLLRLPDTLKEFKENCNGYAAFGDFEFSIIKIMIVEEVS